MLSRVSCLIEATLGRLGELLRNKAAPMLAKTKSVTTPAHFHESILLVEPGTISIFPDVVSRLSRLRSAHNSAELWQRTSRSFSRALPMTRSSSIGISGLRRVGGVGVASRMALKITPEVSPRNGKVPVHIS